MNTLRNSMVYDIIDHTYYDYRFGLYNLFESGRLSYGSYTIIVGQSTATMLITGRLLKNHFKINGNGVWNPGDLIGTVFENKFYFEPSVGTNIYYKKIYG